MVAKPKKTKPASKNAGKGKGKKASNQEDEYRKSKSKNIEKEMSDETSSDSSDSSSSDDENKLKKSNIKEESSEDDSQDEDEESDSESEEEGSNKFTDENAKWLKPKKKAQLLSSDDEDEDDDDSEGSESSEDDDDDEEDLLEIEKQSRMIDQEIEAEREEAEEEMRETVAKHTAIYHLPTEEEIEEDTDRVIPPAEIRQHIESILEVLAEFKSRREQGRTRSEYVDRLSAFMAELYGYLPELTEYFMTMFSPAEALEFIDASDKPRPLVIRTNTLKMRRKDLAAALMKRGVSIDPLAAWSKVGLKIIESPVPIGATPEYLSGMYMLQSAASMCPVMALGAQPKERVLDMSAAPGGKTSYIAQLMRNTGVVFANDLKPERQKATVANMHRLGVKNVITCTHDGRQLGKMFKNRFDRILLDAPCSGLGVISRDPSVKVQRTIADVNKCGHLQKELLLSAIDALNHKSKTGGIMVYSTCSVSVAENEEVIQYALSKRDIKIIDSGLAFGKPGFTRYQHRRFHPSVALTRRFYPHVHNMDGFFVAKIQKLSDEDPTKKGKTAEEKEAEKSTEKAKSEDNAAEVKKVDSKKSKKRKKGKGGADNRKESKKAKKSRHVSVIPAPKQPQQKKKKTNAKVTKPRRTKVATDI